MFRPYAEQFVFPKLPYGLEEPRVNNPYILHRRRYVGQGLSRSYMGREQFVQGSKAFVVASQADVQTLPVPSKIHTDNRPDSGVLTLLYKFERSTRVVNICKRQRFDVPACCSLYQVLWRQRAVSKAEPTVTIEKHAGGLFKA